MSRRDFGLGAAHARTGGPRERAHRSAILELGEQRDIGLTLAQWALQLVQGAAPVRVAGGTDDSSEGNTERAQPRPRHYAITKLDLERSVLEARSDHQAGDPVPLEQHDVWAHHLRAGTNNRQEVIDVGVDLVHLQPFPSSAHRLHLGDRACDRDLLALSPACRADGVVSDESFHAGVCTGRAGHGPRAHVHRPRRRTIRRRWPARICSITAGFGQRGARVAAAAA